jgi:predicted nuclease of predicted toxin-antitoxin system
MHFIVDECAGRAVVELLRGAGHDVLAVDEAMPGAKDADILARASTEERVLVTNDKDFGELVFRSGQPHHGVLLLRLRDESPENRLRVMSAVLEQYGDRLADRFTVASEGGVRFRPSAGLASEETGDPGAP